MNNLDKLSVVTPHYARETAGQASFEKRDKEEKRELKKQEMQEFISKLAKTDKKLFDELV